MSHYQKVMTLLPPNREVSYGVPSRSYFYYPNLIKVAPIRQEIKRFVNIMYYEGMTSVPPEAEYPLNEVYRLPKSDVTSFSMNGDI